MSRWRVFAALGGLVASACAPSAASKEVTGELGIFYGGQVQQRQVVELGGERLPTFGFRLRLEGALDVAHRVKWEVVRPGPMGRRVTELGSFDLPPGRAVFDQEVPLQQSAPLGTWNVRVTVDDQLVIDRATSFTRQ